MFSSDLLHFHPMPFAFLIVWSQDPTDVPRDLWSLCLLRLTGLWQFLKSSLLLKTLAAPWEVLGRRPVGAPSIGICLMFFSGLGGPGFWEEDHRGEVSSSPRIWAHAVNLADRRGAGLCHSAQVGFSGFSSFYSSLEGCHYARPTLKGWALCPGSLSTKRLQIMWNVSAREMCLLSSLFPQLWIYISMDSGLCFYTGYDLKLCLIHFVAVAIGRSLSSSCIPLAYTLIAVGVMSLADYSVFSSYDFIHLSTGLYNKASMISGRQPGRGPRVRAASGKSQLVYCRWNYISCWAFPSSMG